MRLLPYVLNISLILSLSLVCSTSLAIEKIETGKLSFYQRAFADALYIEAIEIKDNISENPINDKILKVFNDSKEHIGFIRNIETTTGCNSACLPVVFTLFYDKDKSLKKLLSKPGLTKKYHAKFTDKDYEKLSLILALNPDSFLKVKHPTEMVDIISGATKKEYQNDVVKNAAYTSLRVNLYNQDTLNILKGIK